MAIVPCFDPTTGASGGPQGGGGSTTPPSPPAATSEAVAEDGSPSAKTFGAFTDPDGVITSYQSTLTNVVGSTTVSGTGLGPYTFSGSANGDSFVLELDAKDASANVVATAVHAVDVAPTSTGPALQTLVDISGVTSYDFLTTGGSGGSGGQGDHTVGGITCDVVLQSFGVRPRVIPEHPKMGPLVAALLRHLELSRRDGAAPAPILH